MLERGDLGTPYYGFSCITVTTVMRENLLCEPHSVRGRVSCIMGAPDIMQETL